MYADAYDSNGRMGKSATAREIVYFIIKYLGENMRDRSKIAERIVPIGV
ncbi:hypothetical protein Godav_027727 [Gossypium davidsonii]|uniref:Uncharacterized protein n=2 Tax=Gossypium TaxID=3633 RepID=A0A7J8RYD9_GOSDV|nr:hypothetical protein [Gossypium davidsonii]MBA0653754.1 hypothetical protein [Gossypium klotzschianum]